MRGGVCLFGFSETRDFYDFHSLRAATLAVLLDRFEATESGIRQQPFLLVFNYLSLTNSERVIPSHRRAIT
jgi:hypothetical protein